MYTFQSHEHANENAKTFCFTVEIPKCSSKYHVHGLDTRQIERVCRHIFNQILYLEASRQAALNQRKYIIC